MSDSGAAIPICGSFHIIGDDRGSWSRTFESDLFSERGLTVAQASVSLTSRAGTLRGLHSMHLSVREWKLVTCVRGEVWDVAVDVREELQSYGSYLDFSLRGDRGDWVLIPPGYAHGFLSLTDDVILSYTMSARFDEALERGYRYDDPKFAISWPFSPTLISPKDLGFDFVE